MRLFKRQASDTCPQLVSATPISQDEATEAVTANGASEESEKSLDVDKKRDSARRLDKERERGESEKIATAQSFMITRKGISTWGRKVGRRLDQLKRSESSELLSVSGRRRRWSPNRKSYEDGPEEKENGSNEHSSPELPKPKRVSRVESLKNLFRSTERSNFLSSNASSRNVTIQEEVHYPMEKALSEGAIKNVPFQVKSENNEERGRGNQLQEKQRQLSRSIHDLQEQERVIDFILMNQQVLKTREGTALAKETLSKIEKGNSRSDCSMVRPNKSDASPRTRTLSRLESASRNLFNDPSERDSFRNDQQRSCPLTGLEDLMNNLRLGCDESGYDSDSTRAGADSPDSEQCVPRMTKTRSFSITSDDYHGIDLSLPPIIVPPEPPKNTEDVEDVEDVDNTITGSRNFLNDSVTTETTLIVSENEADTDSCDEDTFDDFDRCTKLGFFSENSGNDTMIELSQYSKIRTNEDRRDLPTTSKTKNVAPVSQVRTNLQNQQTKPSITTLKTRKYGSASVMSLLDNAASPCKDSPPATKIPSATCSKTPIKYYSPKRSRSALEAETSPGESINRINKVKRTVLAGTPTPRSTPSSTPAKSTLIRRELKTMKLTIERSGSLGISVERREAVRPFYVISKMDPNGEAARSKLFRIGDEIVRVCGRRLRGMTTIEARSALRNCLGNVELQIAREPTFAFGEEIGDTWADLDRVPRTRNDSEVWTLQENKTEIAAPSESKDQPTAIDLRLKEEIEAPTKRPKSDLSMDTTRDDSDRKMTGMRKFQVIKKRTSHPVCYPRRVTSLSKDLLTVTLEKGSTKKLGFSIVGGSDSKKGYMGIFVKDIMEGGQAAEEGTLRVGDEILAINGIPMDGATHTKALQTFKNAKAGKMILCIGRRDPTNKRLCYKR